MESTVNQNQINDAFWQSLHDEDFQQAQTYLSQGADIEARNLKEQTAFILYAGERRFKIAEWLKDHGANINAQDRQGRTALHILVDTTIASRDLRTFDEFLTWHPNLDIQDRQGVTPATLAAISRKGEDVLERLLDKGANPSIAPVSGASGLLGAAAQAYEKTVLMLIDKGANPNQVDHDGKTFLHALVSSFDAGLLTKVLELNLPIDINQTSKSGSSPLSSAVDMGDVESATALLKAGADPNVRSTNRFGMGATCLQLMILAQPVEGAKNLLAAKKGREKEESQNASTAVDEQSHDNLVKMAIDAGADVWAVDANGRNAWHYLARRQTFSKAIFDLLVEQGLPMDESTGPGGSNPVRAVFDQPLKPYDRQQALQHMIDNGYPVDPPFVELSKEYKDNNPEEAAHKTLSPLAAAVLTRSRYEVQMLLDAGANPNRLDDSEASPLHQAISLQVKEEEKQAVQMMALAGKMKDPVKEMEKIAQIVNNTKTWMVEILMQHGGDPMTESNTPLKKTPFNLAIDHNCSDVVNQFLQKGVDPLQPTSIGDYGLLEALTQGKLELFYALKDYVEKAGRSQEMKAVVLDSALTSPDKWDVRLPYLEVLRTLEDESLFNYQDEDGNTPLIIAAATGQEDLVDIFLSKGANPDLKNKAGESAMMHAIMEQKGDIISSLRRAGAKVNDKNPDGETLESMAQSTHHRHIIKALMGELESNAEVVEFVKPNPLTLEALSKMPEFLEEWKKPIVLLDAPTPAEPPKEENKPKKKGMFGL